MKRHNIFRARQQIFPFFVYAGRAEMNNCVKKKNKQLSDSKVL